MGSYKEISRRSMYHERFEPNMNDDVLEDELIFYIDAEIVLDDGTDKIYLYAQFESEFEVLFFHETKESIYDLELKKYQLPDFYHKLVEEEPGLDEASLHARCSKYLDNIALVNTLLIDRGVDTKPEKCYYYQLADMIIDEMIRNDFHEDIVNEYRKVISQQIG